MRIRLLHVPGCPLIDQLRGRLQECLRRAGVSVTVEESEGLYPSPTLLINGTDVATGHAPNSGASCRLDMPTEEQITTALQKGRTG